MENYKTILLAVDLSKESHNIAKRAQNIARNEDCKIHIIHVVEPLNYAYGSETFITYSDVDDAIKKHAKLQLDKFSARYEIPTEQQHLVVGSTASEIHECADKLKADLIVIGSHGRRGFALLLGATANSVLHGAKCDVLAVRVGKD